MAKASMVQDCFVDIRARKHVLSLTHYIPFTLAEMEQQLLTTPYQGMKKTKDHEVETMQIPPIAKTFYQYIFFYGFPTPEELIQTYMKKHKTDETETHIQFRGNDHYFLKEGVKGRIYRTYPSLVRDFHFYMMCCECPEFDQVSYSLLADIKGGVDLSVIYQEQEFAIALYVNTKRSQSFKQKKYGRHKPLSVPEIRMSIDPFNQRYYKGDYALYQPEHVQVLLNKIKEFVQNGRVE